MHSSVIELLHRIDGKYSWDALNNVFGEPIICYETESSKYVAVKQFEIEGHQVFFLLTSDGGVETTCCRNEDCIDFDISDEEWNDQM